MPAAAGCFRPCSSRSRSSAATRRRSAPPSARISTCRSIAARRRIGRGSEPQPGDPALPDGARAAWPASCARRRSWRAGLAQIGIVEAADGARLPELLAPGQRLVSRDGALWRWDGLVAERRCADRRRAAAGAEEPARRARRRSRRGDAPSCARPSRRLPTPSARCARDRSRARGAAGLARRAARPRRRARRAAEGRKGGRRAHGAPRRAGRIAARLNEAHAEASAPSPRPSSALDAAPDLVGAAGRRSTVVAADGAARSRARWPMRAPATTG